MTRQEHPFRFRQINRSRIGCGSCLRCGLTLLGKANVRQQPACRTFNPYHTPDQPLPYWFQRQAASWAE